jgi:hypothetical protein
MDYQHFSWVKKLCSLKYEELQPQPQPEPCHTINPKHHELARVLASGGFLAK